MRLALGLGLAVVAAGCTIRVGRFGTFDGNDGCNAWLDETEIFDVPAAGLERLTVETHNGAISVRAGLPEQETIHVVATRRVGGDDSADAAAAMAALTVERHCAGGALDVRAVWAHAPDHDWQAVVSYQIELPARLAAKLDSHNGDLRITGLAGAMNAETHNGSITIDGAGGPIAATSHNGTIDCSGAIATIRATSHNGNVSIGTTAPALGGAITSHNGDVSVDLPPDAHGRINGHGRASRFDLDGSHGTRVVINDDDFHIDLADPSAARLEVATHNGAICIR